MTEHTFETLSGDTLSPSDLANATWRVDHTMVDYDDERDAIVFTHRVELDSIDDLVIAEVTP